MSAHPAPNTTYTSRELTRDVAAAKRADANGPVTLAPHCPGEEGSANTA